MCRVEAVSQLVIRVRHAFTIGRIVLPGVVITVQVLPADSVEIIHVDIDVVITVAVITAVIVPVIIVMMVIPVVVIPVNIAENGVGCSDPEAKT